MAIWVENSKDLKHGGEGWEFGTCLWAPTHTKNGGNNASHLAVGAIKAGDLIIHFRSMKDRGPSFLYGYSYALSDGYKTNDQPVFKGEWDYSSEFYRAEVSEITKFVGVEGCGKSGEFTGAVSSKDFFEQFEDQLRSHLAKKRAALQGPKKSLNFFYSPREELIALSQGYCFKADEETWGWVQEATATTESIDRLSENLEEDGEASFTSALVSDLPAEEKDRIQRIRIGQEKIAKSTKKQYGYRCCISNCGIDDPKFLIASHIERWADNEEARGKLGNVLCLCSFHDKAFELGYFYVEDDLSITLNSMHESDSETWRLLKGLEGQSITPPKNGVRPASEYLLAHRLRVSGSGSSDKTGLN